MSTEIIGQIESESPAQAGDFLDNILGDEQERVRQLGIFLPRLFGARGLGYAQQEILGYSGLLRASSQVPSALMDSFRQGFSEALEGFAESMRANTGTFAVSATRRFLQRSESFAALVAEFGQEQQPEEETDVRVLLIPATKITAAQVLPYPSRPGTITDYEPVVNMRIQASTGRPLGNWYNFPLGSVALTHFDIG